jgi:hypothetical protein
LDAYFGVLELGGSNGKTFMNRVVSIRPNFKVITINGKLLPLTNPGSGTLLYKE